MNKAKFGTGVQTIGEGDWFDFCAKLMFSGLMLICSDSQAGLWPQSNSATANPYSEFAPAIMEIRIANGNNDFSVLSGAGSVLFKPAVNAVNLGRGMPMPVAAPFSPSVSLSLELMAMPTLFPLPLSINEFGLEGRAGISPGQSSAYVGVDAISPGKRISPVPLPTAAWMFLTGLMGVLAVCKCRKR